MDTEDEFYFGTDRTMISFSDDKEMPSVQEGDTLVANAGQGITACGTSTYSSKSSFGRRKAFPQLSGYGIQQRILQLVLGQILEYSSYLYR